MLDKAIEYTRTTVVQHTSNEWQKGEYDRYTRSNRVYQMNYHIYENTRYDREKQQSVPYSYSLTWGVYTNSPNRNGQAKIAGQDRKVFSDKAAMEKYLNGRIKAYDRLFTEISPPIPQEYAEHFKVNGMLLPGYTIEGEEPPQQQPQAAAIPETTGQQKEREHMSEQFSIMIGNRSRFEAGDPGGYWLDMPATRSSYRPLCRASALPPITRRIFPFAAIPTTQRNILPCLMTWYAPPAWTNSIFLRRGLSSWTPPRSAS